MKDQCCKLGERGIPATHTGSSQNDASINDKIRNKNFKLIFATPENFFSHEGNPSKVFQDLIEQGHIRLIGINEVHLINSWKHFRYVLQY